MSLPAPQIAANCIPCSKQCAGPSWLSPPLAAERDREGHPVVRGFCSICGRSVWQNCTIQNYDAVKAWVANQPL